VARYFRLNLKQEYLNQQVWRNWQQYLQHIPYSSTDVVLDLGCSVGGVSNLLSPYVKKLTGVDINPDFISHCRSEPSTNEEFICTDVSNYDFHSIAHLSGVWSSFSLSYLARPTIVLSQIFEALNESGWIALVDVSCFISGNLPLASQHYNAVRKYELESYMTGIYDFDFGKKMEPLLSSVGFTIIYRDNDVTDLELNFDGPATAEVIENWQARLSRLVGLKNKFPNDYYDICKEIIENLSSNDHRKNGNVNFVVARK